MRILPILVALSTLGKASSTDAQPELEEGELVRLINVTSEVDEGISPGQAIVADVVAPVGPPRAVGKPETRYLQDGDEELILLPTGGEDHVHRVDVPEEQNQRRLCSYSVKVQKSCYLSGEEVIAEINTCGVDSGYTTGEWAGIYYENDPVAHENTINWHFLCGGQSCNTGVNKGLYWIGFTEATRDTDPLGPWPLPSNTWLQVYFHASNPNIGSLKSDSFYVVPPGYACPPTPAPVTPTTPPPTPPPTPTPPTPTPPTPTPPSCTEAVSVSPTCLSSGQTITVTASTCGSSASSYPGWVGVYYAGTTNFAAALNWEYLCKSQSCASVVSAGTHTLYLDRYSYGSVGWPLRSGPTYQVYMHTGSGTFSSNTFLIGNCGPTPTATPPSPTPPTPTTPSATTAPAYTSGGSSAPATTAGGSNAPATTASGSNAPASSILYVPASAEDCHAVKYGDIVVGQDAMSSQTFYFMFALGTNGQTLTASQIDSIVTNAFQDLIGTSLLNCPSRRLLLKKPLQKQNHHHNNNKNRHHRHHRHRHHHHRHHHRQLNGFANRRRRLELDENVIGNIIFTTTCEEATNCAPLISQCFVCTTQAEVFLKGPADPADVQAAIQEILDSPTFLEDLGFTDADVVYIQPNEDVTLITANPTSGPTSAPTTSKTPTRAPTSSPTSAPTNGPTSRPTTGPTSSPTSVPTNGPTSRPTTGPTSVPTSGPTTSDIGDPEDPNNTDPTSGPTSSPTSVPTNGPTSKPTTGPTSIPTSGPTTSEGGEGPTPTEPAPSPTFPDVPPSGPTTSEGGDDDPPLPPAEDPGSKGDPHFKTWRNEHFEYHGQCDIVLAKDPNFANGLGLDVHIRTKLIRFWSYIQSAVIRIGADVLEIQGKPGNFEAEIHYWINYEYQGELEEFSGFPVTLVPLRTRIDIDLDSVYPGQMISLSAFKEFVKVSFGTNASKEAFGNTIGILGNFTTGETLSRDGSTVINDFTDLGQEWQVLPSDSHLFRLTSPPQFPEPCIEPEDPRGDRARRLQESSVTEEMAEAACAGLKDELDRKDCVYDILATQDMDMAGAY